MFVGPDHVQPCGLTRSPTTPDPQVEVQRQNPPRGVPAGVQGERTGDLQGRDHFARVLIDAGVVGDGEPVGHHERLLGIQRAGIGHDRHDSTTACHAGSHCGLSVVEALHDIGHRRVLHDTLLELCQRLTSVNPHPATTIRQLEHEGTRLIDRYLFDPVPGLRDVEPHRLQISRQRSFVLHFVRRQRCAALETQALFVPVD